MISMRTKFFFLFSFFLFVSVCGFAQKREKHKEKDGFVWYSVQTGNLIEAQTKKKEVIIPLSAGCTKMIYVESHQAFMFRTKENYIGVYARDGRLILRPGKYSNYKLVTNVVNEKLYYVMSGDFWGICNANGEEVIAPQLYSDIEWCYDNRLGNYYKVLKNGLKGICDSNGREVIAPKYDDINVDYEENCGVYYKVEKEKKKGICSSNGCEVIAPKYDYVYVHYEENYGIYYKVRNGNKYGICDSNGCEVIAPKYDNVFVDYEENCGVYYKVEKEKKKGIYDSNGREVIAPDKYSNVYLFNNKEYGAYFSVYSDDNKKGVCDITGKEIVAPIYSSVIYSRGCFRYKHASGEFLPVPDGSFAATDAIVAVGNKFSITDATGKALNKHLYDKVVFVPEQNKYIASVGNYHTKVDAVTGVEDNPITTQIFYSAYNLDDSRSAEQLKIYEYLLSVDPANSYGINHVVYNNIGVIYLNRGEYAQALTYFTLSLSVQPEYAQAKANMEDVRSRIAQAQAPQQQYQQVEEQEDRFSSAISKISEALSNISQIASGASNNSYNYNSNSSYNYNSSSSYSGQSSKSTGGSSTRAARHCTKCAGRGSCSKCGGDGYVLGKFSQEFEPCSSCNFKDRTPSSKRGKCTFCNGTGQK